MSGPEIAALIVAITGAFGAIFAGVRNLKSDKFRKDVEASAALLTGYTSMVASLQHEIDRLKIDHTSDRKAWVDERALMRQEHVDDLRKLRDEHHTELLDTYERIDDLGAQVYALQNRPSETRKRKDEP